MVKGGGRRDLRSYSNVVGPGVEVKRRMQGQRRGMMLCASVDINFNKG